MRRKNAYVPLEKRKRTYQPGLILTLCGDRLAVERWYSFLDDDGCKCSTTEELLELNLMEKPELTLGKNWKKLMAGQKIGTSYVTTGIPKRNRNWLKNRKMAKRNK